MAMRLDPSTSLLAVIDVQQRLLPVIPGADSLVARVARLAEAARLLGVRAVVTEQYPRGLGPTDARLRPLLPPADTKLAFSAACAPCLDGDLGGAAAVVVCGLETHVCIANTVLDLLARGVVVFVPVDAVAARHAIDHDTALRRLEGAGAIPTTTEAILFEWCRTAEHPAFKAVQALVKEPLA
jgi:nicotinamidase-related amidase